MTVRVRSVPPCVSSQIGSRHLPLKQGIVSSSLTWRTKTIGGFKLQGNELKGSNLIKHSAGRKAIDFLLEKCVDDSKVVFFNKKYAAAAKFYEWTFDEIFGNHNTFFYVANFHRFISNAL